MKEENTQGSNVVLVNGKPYFTPREAEVLVIAAGLWLDVWAGRITKEDWWPRFKKATDHLFEDQSP